MSDKTNLTPGSRYKGTGGQPPPHYSGGGGGKGSYPPGNGNGSFHEGGGGPNGDGSDNGEPVNGVFQSSTADSPSLEVTDEMIDAAMRAFNTMCPASPYTDLFRRAAIRAAIVTALIVR